jgi:hypothetical protein
MLGDLLPATISRPRPRACCRLGVAMTDGHGSWPARAVGRTWPGLGHVNLLLCWGLPLDRSILPPHERSASAYLVTVWEVATQVA